MPKSKARNCPCERLAAYSARSWGPRRTPLNIAKAIKAKNPAIGYPKAFLLRNSGTWARKCPTRLRISAALAVQCGLASCSTGLHSSGSCSAQSLRQALGTSSRTQICLGRSCF